MEEKRYIIAIDFDGTLCPWDFPNIGKPSKVHIMIIKYLRKAHELGAIICLWTCRSNGVQGHNYLDEAVMHCDNNEIPIDYINDSPNTVGYEDWYSRKIFANEYIDDQSIGGIDMFLDQKFIDARLENIKKYLDVKEKYDMDI